LQPESGRRTSRRPVFFVPDFQQWDARRSYNPARLSVAAVVGGASSPANHSSTKLDILKPRRGSEIVPVDQVHDHLAQGVLLRRLALGDEQGQGDEGVIDEPLRAVPAVEQTVGIQKPAA
jgi:hypothetical protein